MILCHSPKSHYCSDDQSTSHLLVAIDQSIEFRAATVLTLNAEETFHAIHVQSPSLLMIFSGGHYTELNYSVSFGEE